MEMRYQLRYSPVRKKERLAAASFFLWAREDLNLRPHPYQGCALTSGATGPIHTLQKRTADYNTIERRYVNNGVS